jgi:hypothetical protein
VGEIEYIHLLRDKDTGKSIGSAFIKYEDCKSGVLAVDNFNGVSVSGSHQAPSPPPTLAPPPQIRPPPSRHATLLQPPPTPYATCSSVEADESHVPAPLVNPCLWL